MKDLYYALFLTAGIFVGNVIFAVVARKGWQEGAAIGGIAAFLALIVSGVRMCIGS